MDFCNYPCGAPIRVSAKRPFLLIDRECRGGKPYDVTESRYGQHLPKRKRPERARAAVFRLVDVSGRGKCRLHQRRGGKLACIRWKRFGGMNGKPSSGHGCPGARLDAFGSTGNECGPGLGQCQGW